MDPLQKNSSDDSSKALLRSSDIEIRGILPSSSLSQQDQKNIFIKQDLLRPLTEFKEIENFKLISRIFVFTIILIIILLRAKTNKNIGYITDQTSPYYNKQQSYIFGNPCEYNPNIITSLGTNISKCTSIANGTFKQGLSSFLRYGQRLGESCILIKQIQQLLNWINFVQKVPFYLHMSQMQLQLGSASLLKKFQPWKKKNIIHTLIVIISLLLIHLIFIQLKVMKTIFSDYQFIKKFYLNLVPQSILINEKVVKQKIIIKGLIQPRL